ncbi:MAG: replication endonuclease [Gammaproteobacteria bacterium]|nr:replication endonuclease [Gammaproteobacteria bacterium]MDH3750789.1 replication endonuclease [Gammaproteobacteria bacterium]
MTTPKQHLGPLSQSGRSISEAALTEIHRLENELEPIDIAGYHRKHRQSILPKFPPKVQVALMREYLQVAGPERSWPDGAGPGKHCSWAKANARLWRRDVQLTKAKIQIAFSEHEIRLKAQHCASTCSRLTMCCRSLPEAYAACSQYATDQEIAAPRPRTSAISTESALSRLLCEFWWRRQLRMTFARLAEAGLRDLGFVSKQTGIYASDETVNRRTEQKKRQRQMLEGLMAINDLGEAFSLAEIADSSNSNPKIRRCEMMARVAGIEQYAQANGLSADLYTLTAPSRFHAFLSSGRPNSNYREQNPRDAQKWLTKNWARIRAKLARDRIDIFGVRIAEPHHDGTTHWHLLIFSKPNDRPNVQRIIRGYMLQDAPDEAGAQKHRVNVTPIDYRRGSATAYIAKYVSKNIDGVGVGQDLEAENSASCSDNAIRVEAWASTWSIRQFQFFGTPPIGPWRELRRVREAVKTELERFRRAADQGQWSDYIREMGGACRRMADYPVRLWRRLRDQPGYYGDPPRHETIGVCFGGVEMRTRDRDWTIAPFAPLEFCQ